MLAEANQYKNIFRQLIPFNRFGPAQQDQAFSDVEVLEFDDSQVIFAQGSRDGYTYYLLDGTLDLCAENKVVKRVVSGTDASLNPIGHIQPRRVSARTGGHVTVLRLRRGVLEELLSARQAPAGGHAATEQRTEAGGESATDAAPGKIAAALKPQLFAKLPPSSLPGLFAAMELVKFKAGDNVIRQGDVGDYYYIIKEGSCEVRRTTSVSAHGIKLAELKPGDAFGEDALISNMRRNATVRMMTDGELIRIGKEDFVQFIRKALLKNVSFEQGMALVRDGAFWIDVRFPEECRNGALAGSVNIPLNILRIHATRLDARKRYIVYCDDGSRSAVAAFILRERGFDASCVEGGCAGELAALFAIEGGPPKNPDLTATAVPKQSTEEEGVQETVPLTGHHQGKDLLKELQALELAGSGGQTVVVADSPPIPSATTVAPPSLLHSDGLTPPLVEPPAPLLSDAAAPAAPAELTARTDDYESRAREAAERMRSQDAALQYAHAKLREYEADAEKARRDSAHLQEALVAAEAKIADQESALRQYTEQIKDYEDTLGQSGALARERDQLQQSYRDRVEELEHVLAARTEAEHLLSAERQKLVGELAEQRRLLEETRRQLRETPGQEQQLQAATQTQLAELRKILGAEFARNAALVELARQERASAEAARRRLVKQTEAVIAEYRARNEKVRAQEEARLREERRLLEMERDFLKSATEAAFKAREQAEAMVRRAEEQAARVRALMTKEIDSIEADVAADMKRVRQSAALATETPRSPQSAPGARDIEQSQLREEIEHRVNNMLTDKAVAPAASAKILDLQRQDIERIQKRTEEARDRQTGQVDLIIKKSTDSDEPPAS
ncbi:MAG: cyclic nucleotide-binding domain-containing protein [Chromatiales bacterium]